MSELDWTEAVSSIGAASLRRGVTGGATPPLGGGTFVYGWNSLDNAQGTHAMYTTQANFAPLAKGGRIQGCIQRAESGGPLNYAPFLFIGLQGTAVSNTGYILGLSDSEPSHIVLRKGTLLSGLPDAEITTPPDAPIDGVLRRSTDPVALGEWVHLQLDMIWNQNGDVVLNVARNNLAVNPATAPVFVPIPGLGQFIDDALGVNSNSAPLVGGYMGFGMWKRDVNRRSYVDHFECARQP